MPAAENWSGAFGNKKFDLQALVEGIGWGLFLTILMGPILFALLQAAIEYGFRAGAVMGLGIWCSDVIYILVMYFGFKHVEAISQMQGFEFWMGLIGGIALMLFGSYTFFSPPPNVNYDQLNAPRSNPYFTLFTKGFLINSLNPFTVFFWLGMMTTSAVKPDWDGSDQLIFFAAIILTIMSTDLTKVFLAKQIRKKLSAKYLQWIRWITGSILAIFGIVLILRTW